MSKTYSIQQLASMAGISVRTLHHYDHIGLLCPASRSTNRYRQYGEKDLLKLQQILFYKELDFGLEEIKTMISNPKFDIHKALSQHKNLLQQKIERLNQLIQTIDKTILHIMKDELITDEELYAGFSKEQKESYDKEARERWGDKAVEDSVKRAKKMTKEEFAKIKAETEAIGKDLAELMDQGFKVDSSEVQAVVQRHYNWIGYFYTPTPEVYEGLGDMYVNDSRFKATYEKFKPGLAQFLRDAMKHYSKTILKK